MLRTDVIATALGLLAVLLLILATGFFVAVEFALVATHRQRAEADAAGGSRRARRTVEALRHLSFHLSGAELGITVTSLVVGFIAEPTVADALEPVVGDLVGEDRAPGISIAVALVLATVVSMVVGELVPKTLAIARPRAVAYTLTPAMVLVCKVLRPVILLLNGAANWSVRRLGIEPQEELTSVRSLDELELLIRSSGVEGTLEPEATTLLTRSIRFGTKDAADALVPRLAVHTLAIDDSVADLAATGLATGKSRFPVVGADLDDVRGVVHVKDVYSVPFEDRATTRVGDVMVPPFVVPETRDLGALLADLRRVGTHLAVVVDQHGGTAGIITLEDILEEIVGEIDDEHDRPAPGVTGVQRPGEWQLEGTLHRDQVYDVCGFSMPEGEYETLAGFVLERLGRIPVVGDAFEHEGWHVEVVALDGRRVASVLLRRAAAAGAGRLVTARNLLLALVLLLANGFFVAVEFALVASRRTKLEGLADQGSARARLALGAMRQLNVQLAGAQLGITMASLLLGYVAEPAVAGLIEDAVHGIVEVPEGVLHTIGFVVALTLVAFLHMVIGEMVPKNIAIADPERTLLRLALANRVYVTVFGPVLRVLNAVSNAGVRALGVQPRDELATSASAQELAMMLGASRDEGLIEEVAHQLLTGALDLQDRSVATVMVPRDGIGWLPRTATPAEAEEQVVASGHTRLVIAGSGVDDVLGYLHARDLLGMSGAARHRPLPLGRIRRMLVVPRETSLDDALVAMQRARLHVALVVGPDGATAGLATLEDVIEALVGDIRDESDR